VDAIYVVERDARFAAIKQGFDHIRGRNPKR
jgi:hypothetical protein